MEQTLDRLFESVGVQVLNYVITVDNGEQACRFAKVVTPEGHVAFVLVDVEGYVPDRETNILVKFEKSNSITHSYKHNSYHYSNMETHGVAILCGNEMCVLTRDDDEITGTPDETSFSLEGVSPVTLSSNPLSYPVIRLTDLLGDPQEALLGIANATKLLRRSNYEKAYADMKISIDSVDILYDQASRFVEQVTRIANILKGQPETQKVNEVYTYLIQNMKTVGRLRDSLSHASELFETLSQEMEAKI